MSLLAIPLEVIPLTLLKSDHSIMNSRAEAAIHSERSITVSIVQQTLESLHICTSIAFGQIGPGRCSCHINTYFLFVF